MLKNSSVGFGALALDVLLSQDCRAEAEGPLAPRNTHFEAKAKSLSLIHI